MVDIYHNMSQIFDEILFGTPASVTGRKGDGRQLFFLFIGSLFSLLCKDVTYLFDSFPVGGTGDGRYYFFFSHFCYYIIEVLEYGEMFHIDCSCYLSVQKNLFLKSCKGTLSVMAISYYGSPK